MKSYDDVFTTGDIAKICRVSTRTVSMWYDKGLLKGYQIPGSRDRRILKSNLLDFLRENDMPLAGLGQGILYYGCDAELVRKMTNLLPECDNFEHHAASDTFQCGVLFREKSPRYLVLDYTHGASPANLVANGCKGVHAVFRIYPEDIPVLEETRSFKKPFDADKLADAVLAAR